MVLQQTLFKGCNRSMAQSMLAYTHQTVTRDGQEGLRPPHAVRPPRVWHWLCHMRQPASPDLGPRSGHDPAETKTIFQPNTTTLHGELNWPVMHSMCSSGAWQTVRKLGMYAELLTRSQTAVPGDDQAAAAPGVPGCA